MKKLSLFVMPLMAVSFLVSCGGNNTPQVVEHFVTFESKGGTHIDTQRIKDGGTATKPTITPERADYKFEGWFTDDLTFEKEYKFTESVTDDITLYAKWDPTTADTYTITFKNDGADYDIIDEIEPGHIIENTELPQNPSKTGYTFTGWCADEGGKNIFDFSKIEIRQDYTLYAGYELIVPEAKYTITFMNGSSEVSKITDIEPGTIVSEGIPEGPTKEHYTFIGWCTDEEGKNVFDFPNMPIHQEYILYAGYEKNAIITFKKDGQPYGNPTEIEKGTIIPVDKRPVEPTKEYYIFTGWGSDADGEHLVDLNTTKFYEDTTLHANWVSELITDEVSEVEFNKAISMENETYLQCDYDMRIFKVYASTSVQISDKASMTKQSIDDGFTLSYQYLNEDDGKYYAIRNNGEGWSEPAQIEPAQFMKPTYIGGIIQDLLTELSLNYSNFTYEKSLRGVGSYVYTNISGSIHIDIKATFENKKLIAFTYVTWENTQDMLEIDEYMNFQMKYEEIIPPDPRNP